MEKEIIFSEIRDRLIKKATVDTEFRARLLAEPCETIASETGVTVPAGFRIEVHEETADTGHLILPLAANIELGDDDLEQVSGGIDWGLPNASTYRAGTRGAGAKCFRLDALVRLADGREIPAGEVRLGDELFSPAGVAVVAGLHQAAGEERWVSVNGGEPFFTDSHPVVTRRGEVPGGSLQPGDVLTLAGDVTEVVRTVDLVTIAQPSVNIETEGSMPYFVNGLLFGSAKTRVEQRPAGVRAA